MLKRDERFSGSKSLPSELRTEFQRDRDRILYSAQFRRLSGITQVTTPTELHVFHNRLTHTLEVAQIARRIAERAQIQLGAAACVGVIDPDVCEAAALAHDLGHPPFGHNGEKVLDSVALKLGIGDGFEGNAQSLRILLKLAMRGSDDRGLDLTAATLRATIKYPWRRGANKNKPDKFGVYEADAPEFSRIWAGLRENQQTIEAQIMDWADDVAYSTHDFYDFALAGIIPIAGLKTITAGDLRRLLVGSPDASQAVSDAFEVVARSFELLPDPPLQSTSRLTSPSVGMLKQWVSFLIGRYAATEIYFEGSGDDLRFQRNGVIEQEVAILKALTYHYAIGSPALAVRQEGERRILKTLFEILWESANTTDKKLLSEDARERITIYNEPTGRVVLDILSSMTDAQAISMFHKLTGIAPISVLDLTTPSAF